MVIIAIDPGNEESAFCSYDTELKRPLYFKKIQNNTLLQGLKEVKAERLIVEMIACYGMAVGATVFETCTWIGRFEQQWVNRAGIFNETTMHRLKRMEVKMHLCKSTRAKDGNIRQALIDRFGVPGTKKNQGVLYGMSGDCWAALAIAVTWADQNETNDKQ